MKKLFYLLMVALCATMFSACSDDDDKDPMNEEEEGGEGVITMVAEWYYTGEMVAFSFNEGDIITIDWGDGTIQEYKTVLNEYYDEEEEPETIRYGTDWFEHEYSNANPHTITIKGNISGVDCATSNLFSLDVSKCTKLTYLFCGGNLTSLDVSKNTALTYLACINNSNLTSLDVSKCTKLTYLRCENNNLSSLDVSKCTKLTYLGCDQNGLTSLDVSKCTELTELRCYNNKLTSSALNKIFGDLPQGKEFDIYPYQSRITIGGNPGTDTCDRSIAENKGWKVSN